MLKKQLIPDFYTISMHFQNFKIGMDIFHFVIFGKCVTYYSYNAFKL